AIDETLVLEGVGAGCVFLAKSSRVKVPELLKRFENFFTQRTKGVNELLKQSGLDNLKFDYVEPNFVFHLDGPDFGLISDEPNDDKYVKGVLWGLVNTGFPGFDIDARGAWKYSTGTNSIVVGIVDTGIYYRHPDLAANMWSASKPFTVELGGRQITCGQGTHGY